MNTFNWLQVILPVAASAILPLLALLATPAGVPVLSWLIGTRAGRVVAGIGIVLMMSWLVWRAGRQDGVARVRTEAAAKRLEDLATKVAVESELQAMSPSERRERLHKWVR